jgi:hypothetical protein
MVQLEILRVSSQKDCTLGLVFDISGVARKFLCFSLEDEFREKKVHGRTRIPAGTYEITLRREGGFHQRYAQTFKDIHQGMLWVRNVPNFEFILWHAGNDHTNTEGCLLVGDQLTQNVTRAGFLGSSQPAYRRIYPPIAAALQRGEKVFVTYIDYDTP